MLKAAVNLECSANLIRQPSLVKYHLPCAPLAFYLRHHYWWHLAKAFLEPTLGLAYLP